MTATNVVVEGDIRLSKRHHLGNSPTQFPKLGGPSTQWSSSSIVSSSTIASIRVNIGGLSSAWQAAAVDAMSAWNSLTPGSRISISQGSSPHITLHMAGLGVGIVAHADFPSGGNPGDTIRVSHSYGHYNHSQMVFVLVHEFGHTIGLRHSNWNQSPNAESQYPLGANQIYQTPTTDANSIMNKATGGFVWAGFSFYDQVAGFNLYPPAGPVANSSNSGGYSLISWNSNALVQSYVVDYVESGETCYGDPGIPCDPINNTGGVGTTSSTSITDNSRPWTGVSHCSYPDGSWLTAAYVIYANYAAGQTNTVIAAKVLSC